MPYGQASGQGYNDPVNTRVIIIAPGQGDGVFLYNPTPGLNNLIASLVSTATQDPYGNPVRSNGLEIQPIGDTGQKVFVGLASGGQGFLAYFSGDAIENDAGFIEGFEGGVGAGRFLALNIDSPQLNVAGHTDRVIQEMNSPNAGGTSSANGEFIYQDTVVAGHQTAYWDSSGFNIRSGTVNGVVPGTGTVAIPGVAESWHGMSLLNGWSNLGTPGGPDAKYRMLSTNEVQVIGAITNGATSGTSQIATLPAGYSPPNTQRRGVTVTATNAYAATAITPLLRLNSAGALTLVNLPAGTTSIEFECKFPMDA